jgi:signal transduction histidine kinase
MKPSQRTPRAAEPGLHRLLAYVADLELEVDRLRRHNHLVQQEARAALRRIRAAHEGGGDATAAAAEVEAVAAHLSELLDDLRDPHGYHPAHDQVVAIAVRPLAEQVFRWQQRLEGAAQVSLRLDLGSEPHVDWFPARLRHILDNLISNALKYCDLDKAESWIRLGVRALPQGYELRLSDNGLGLPMDAMGQVFELFYRAGPARAAAPGVGLAVVRMLVEQSGGSVTVDSGEGQGTTFVVTLPRYPVDDFLV